MSLSFRSILASSFARTTVRRRRTSSRVPLRRRQPYKLTSNGYQFQSLKHGTVGQLYSNFENGISNELFLGYTTIRDRRSPYSTAPMITINERRWRRIGGWC